MHRECLDWMIPISEAHLRAILIIWVARYHRGRPHGSLGSDMPDPQNTMVSVRKAGSRHRRGQAVAVRSICGLRCLRHECSLAPAVACSATVIAKGGGNVNICGAQAQIFHGQFNYFPVGQRSWPIPRLF